MVNLNQELVKIKNGEPSFLGIDGGDITSKIWFCGIEFGGQLDKMEQYYKTVVKYYSSSKVDEPVPYRKNAGKFENSKFDLFLSEMIMNLFDIVNIDRKNYLKNKLYNEDSNIFKLNLYPLAKKDTGWDDAITKMFGITKDEYYGMYFENRKKFLKTLLNEFNPKIIICTATKYSETQFVEAFFKNDEKIEYSWNYIKYSNPSNKQKMFKISKYHQNNTSLIIIPFPGMGNGNLNSYDDVIFMANYLKENYL